jgi:hypothetical protein
MKTLTYALIAAAMITVAGTTPLQAGVTCQVVPSWCPPPPGGGGPASVPEPATLMVLAAGACAAGLAARRRRK